MENSWLVRRGSAAVMAATVGVMLAVVPATSGAVGAAAGSVRQVGPPAGFADPALKAAWERADKPVAEGRTQRSWMWGPAPGISRFEAYKGLPGGGHLVQYFDKARMEINDPNASKSDPYYVTNGLLVVEMITGRRHVSDNSYLDLAPNYDTPVAGDSDGNAPSYSAFYNYSSVSPDGSDAQKVEQGAEIPAIYFDYEAHPTSVSALPGAVAVKAAAYENGHNIPDVFWDFMNAQGLVYENGTYRNGALVNRVAAFGYPITEPYWINIKVGTVTRLVLFQAFERRTLTFSPNNPQGWEVEMGNVGADYLRWLNSGKLCFRMQYTGLNSYIDPAEIGCSYGDDQAVQTAYQQFEHGAMLYAGRTVGGKAEHPIYVMFDDGTFGQYEDTWREGEPVSGGLTPPSGLYEPQRGFGKLWRDGEAGKIRARLGWATTAEAGGPGTFKAYPLGEAYSSTAGGGKVFIFYGIEQGAAYPVSAPGPTDFRLRYTVR